MILSGKLALWVLRPGAFNPTPGPSPDGRGAVDYTHTLM